MAQGSTAEPLAGPSTARISKISGTTPGLLDPSQAERLCRIPNSKLTFAAFNPFTASTQQEVHDIRKLSLNEELYRPKRIVIETAPTGECFWRFVPSARRDDDVLDEGKWPRIVELCGALVECSQDQWDIYKLDPLYDCRVRSYPNLTVVSKVAPKLKTNNGGPVGPKRRASSTPEPILPTPNPRKKAYPNVVELHAESDEETEVEGMIIDDGPSISRLRPGDRAKRSREEIERNRKARREKFIHRTERLTKQEDNTNFEFVMNPTQSQSVPPELVGKRKVNSLFNSLRSNGDAGDAIIPEEESPRSSGNYSNSKPFKRRRTVSPASAKRDLETRRLERETRKQHRREQELNARRQEREIRFLNELYTEIDLKRNGIPSQGTQEMLGVSSDEEEAIHAEASVSDEDAVRQAAIAESRRKLAELEADRPLWEEQAKKRMERERAEEDALREKAEARRRAAQLQAEADRREKARQEHEAKVKQNREAEEMARRERDRRQRQQRWSYGPWTAQRALERYRVLCESFDGTKFTACNPLTADIVPWPVLQSPLTFSVEDVNWFAVEKFFYEVKGLMRPQDYKCFVEKSHRRFHPDRWRSRSLLKGVIDETERACMEVAANIVAQALTPIWQELNGR